MLICSNTNQAVDQLLHQLCRKMRETNDPALDEGRVIRLGRIEEELEKVFGDFITPERIAERKSAALMQRKSEIESELERLGREVAYAEEVLRRFLQLDAAREANAQTKRQLQGAELEREQAQSVLSAAQSKQTELASELERWQQAGALRRLLMRSERVIRLDSISQQSRVTVANNTFAAANQKLSAAQSKNQQVTIELVKAEKAVAGEDRERNKQRVAEYNSKRQPLREELADIAKRLEDIRNAVLREARIVGATVTRTFLRPIEFSAFDTVIIDGVTVDLRNDIHEKVVLIDNKIVWFGSLNPLSHTPRTSELMARVDNAGVASHLASILSVRRRSAEDLERGAFTEPENPRCEQCSGWSVLIRGKYGPFFGCANGCEWKQNVDAPRRRRN